MKQTSLRNPEIGAFRAYYARAVFDRALALTQKREFQQFFCGLERAKAKPGSRIIIMGNGGNYANAQLLAKWLGERNCLVPGAYDFVGSAVTHGTENCFVRYLEKEGRKGDSAILLSGSGNSPNIIRAAEHCGKSGISATVMCGSGNNGRIMATPAQKIIVELGSLKNPKDQQICEDAALLALAHGANGRKAGLFDAVSQNLASVNAKFIEDLSFMLFSSFRKGRDVVFFPIFSDTLATILEHIAHNLMWDVNYKLKDKSTAAVHIPSNGPHATGLTNDSGQLEFFVDFLDRLNRKFVALVVYTDGFNKQAATLMTYAGKMGAQAMSLTQAKSSSFAGDLPFQVSSMMAGHMAGRVVNWLFAKKQGLERDLQQDHLANLETKEDNITALEQRLRDA